MTGTPPWARGVTDHRDPEPAAGKAMGIPREALLSGSPLLIPRAGAELAPAGGVGSGAASPLRCGASRGCPRARTGALKCPSPSCWQSCGNKTDPKIKLHLNGSSFCEKLFIVQVLPQFQISSHLHLHSCCISHSAQPCKAPARPGGVFLIPPKSTLMIDWEDGATLVTPRCQERLPRKTDF